MKRAIFRCHGTPEDVIEVIDEADPAPGPGEVRVRNSVMSINPADLLQIEGRYGAEPISLPATPGVGAYGIVDALGAGVSRLAVGDAVLPIGVGLWSDTVVVHERMAPKAPAGADPAQAAMMRANPGTAHLMLTTLVDLKPGDWIVQNAANSAVGRLIIRFAHAMGVHSVNIVRRADVVKELRREGADVVIVEPDAHDLATAIAAAAGAAPRLALDAVGGAQTNALAHSVVHGGTVAVYGLLSGEQSRVDARDLVFRDVRLRGFWLAEWYQSAGADAIRDLHAVLNAGLASGQIHSEIAGRYPLSRVKEAVAHAAQGGRDGKIILIGEHDA